MALNLSGTSKSNPLRTTWHAASNLHAWQNVRPARSNVRAHAFKMIQVTLRRPLGMVLAEDENDKTVFVEELTEGGNADQSGKVSMWQTLSPCICHGVTVVACQICHLCRQSCCWRCAFPVRTVETIIISCLYVANLVAIHLSWSYCALIPNMPSV